MTSRLPKPRPYSLIKQIRRGQLIRRGRRDQQHCPGSADSTGWTEFASVAIRFHAAICFPHHKDPEGRPLFNPRVLIAEPVVKPFFPQQTKIHGGFPTDVTPVPTLLRPTPCVQGPMTENCFLRRARLSDSLRTPLVISSVNFEKMSYQSPMFETRRATLSNASRLIPRRFQ